jgi:hypothetical protein
MMKGNEKCYTSPLSVPHQSLYPRGIFFHFFFKKKKKKKKSWKRGWASFHIYFQNFPTFPKSPPLHRPTAPTDRRPLTDTLPLPALSLEPSRHEHRGCPTRSDEERQSRPLSTVSISLSLSLSLLWWLLLSQTLRQGRLNLKPQTPKAQAPRTVLGKHFSLLNSQLFLFVKFFGH